jgi:hypothetical protein
MRWFQNQNASAYCELQSQRCGDLMKSLASTAVCRIETRPATAKVLRIATLMLATAALAITMAAPRVRAQTPAGDVTAIKGEASAETTNAKRALAQGGPVFVDDMVTTGTAARLTLTLGRNTTIKLGEKVRIRLDKHMVNAGGAFDLQSGAVLFDRGAGAPKGDTAFRSPYGLLAVRGTKFFAGPSNDVFGIFVVRGRVDVTAGGKTVRLTAGLGTNIKNPGDAPTPPAPWKAPRVKAALASVQ